MIRVLIADDEPLARRGLEQLLARHVDYEIVASCRNGAEALKALREQRPDVAFIDVEMPGLDGFDVLKLTDARPVVVFVTAYDEFAVRAFEERAVDYLLKPVTQARFDDTLGRVREQLAARNVGRVVIPGATSDVVLRETEIDWIEAADYCCVIHARGRRHILRASLATLEQQLDATRFVRVHRSALVRVDCIQAVTREGPTSVILRDGTRIPVSRRRREAVASLLRS